MKQESLQKKIIALGFFLLAFSISAHGDDKPGPHGGKIQMPGPFHTEVLNYQDKGFKVYLLDINFENPTSKNSFVKAKIKTKEKEISLLCTPHPDHFYCEKNSSNVKSEGELYILAERNFAKGMEIKYQLPIKEN